MAKPTKNWKILRNFDNDKISKFLLEIGIAMTEPIVRTKF